jgi:hypothetical protein
LKKRDLPCPAFDFSAYFCLLALAHACTSSHKINDKLLMFMADASVENDQTYIDKGPFTASDLI